MRTLCDAVLPKKLNRLKTVTAQQISTEDALQLSENNCTVGQIKCGDGGKDVDVLSYEVAMR